VLLIFKANCLICETRYPISRRGAIWLLVEMTLPIQELGRLIATKRGGRGIRAAATDVGTSPATLSRVENGHMPDLVTFAKICRWLDMDPREFLGLEEAEEQHERAVVHFKKKKTVSMDTANALGELILRAQDAVRARNELIGR
jgi:transcriptional regulator with XRE-family HTH domain